MTTYELRCSTDEIALKAARRIVEITGGSGAPEQKMARVQVAVTEAIIEWHAQLSEPAFIRQSGECMDDTARWFLEAGTEMRAKGASWVRFSTHPELNLALVEGWREKPADEGEPRWQLVAA